MFLWKFTEAVSISPFARLDEHCDFSNCGCVCFLWKRLEGSLETEFHSASSGRICCGGVEFTTKISSVTLVAFVCSFWEVQPLHLCGGCLCGWSAASRTNNRYFPLKSIDLCGCWNYLLNHQFISRFNTHITRPRLPFCFLDYFWFCQRFYFILFYQ